MNTIEQLCDQLRIQFPKVQLQITPPLWPEGIWTLDVSDESHWIVVDWAPPNKFGVSLITKETPFGGGADKIFSSMDEVRQGILELLATEP